MGISIAICELDSDKSLCKKDKLNVLKVYLKDIAGYEALAEYDLVLPMAEAKKALGADLEGFLKRNRIDAETETIYLEKVKQEADLAKLKPLAQKKFTGWIIMEKADAATKKKLLDIADPDEEMTQWEMLSFEEMGATCKRCELSWDEGRGCIGTFGPETSELPVLAKKYGCGIIASVPEAVKKKTKFKVDDAPRLIEEVEVMRTKLPLESKMAVRRYSGVLDRLEKTANVCIKYGTRFYFI